jgi:hypothetical protein
MPRFPAVTAKDVIMVLKNLVLNFPASQEQVTLFINGNQMNAAQSSQTIMP